MHSTKTTSRGVTLTLMAFFMALMVTKTTFGQRQDGSVILSITEFTVKPGHNTKFKEGVKAWKACYIEKDGDWNWDMWSRMQGEGNMYVLTSFSENWADFDETDEAGRNCREISRELINPNVESYKYLLARTMPDNSSKNPLSLETKVLWVTYWTVNNPLVFMESVNEVHNAMKELEGDIRGRWYRGIGGGPDDFDYMAVSSFNNFAGMDMERPGAWDVLESSKGEEHTRDTRDSFRESIETGWSYIYTWVEDLSRRPVGESSAD